MNTNIRSDKSPTPWLIKNTTLLILFSISIRLIYLANLDLLAEEAYYWQFSKHLSYGYLDHPPMSAWLISVSTLLLGDNEFAVRLPAVLCWMVGGFYLFKLATQIYGREAAQTTLLLYSTLPYFFGNSFFVSPDAPLVACWAGALYYLYQVFENRSAHSWLGVGICLGFGMLSKYTIALVGISTVLFILLHKPSRFWLTKVAPYATVILTAAIFSPVIYWNATHDWVSFAFQSSRRLDSSVQFSLHRYLFDIIGLVTPTAAVAAYFALAAPTPSDKGSALSLFVRIYALVPICVFAVFSLRHSTKLNWSGPSFLVLLPLIAAQINGALISSNGKLYSFLNSCWKPTILIMSALYWVALQYLSFGFPYVPYSAMSRRAIGWSDLGKKVSVIAKQITAEQGKAPILVGMDKHNITAELAFYAPEFTVAGRAVFGLESLMFAYWIPDNIVGRDLLLIAHKSEELDLNEISSHFDRMSEIIPLPTEKHGDPTWVFQYRVGYNYRP